MVRSIKWNQEDALVARRFKQELAPSMGSMGLVRVVHDRLATAGKEEQARLCIWTVKRAIHKLFSPYFPSSNQAHTNS
ncbi:hypothetical protein HID58_092039 [Brassica napus]|uniref:Uncharacterized protein n=1 Tax=Brassica napus TaxID=3708 RepID=A0ABQ7WXS5_BRANA|nr:hypothetical protein HID58_092039 [Brassica napus]